MTNQPITVDIAIVGGGIVGLTAALALTEQNFSVALINQESFDPISLKKSADLRVSAISRASETIFQNLKIWDEILKQRVSPFREMRVWDATGNGAIHFSAQQLSEPHLGHIIENHVVQNALLARLKNFPHVHFIQATPTQAAITDSQVILTLDNQQLILSQLLVGADGANSWVRETLKIPVKMKTYGHEAIVANVATTTSHQATAWQRFLPTGPLAFLPLVNEQECSIVWSCVPELASELMTLSDDEFKQRLAIAFDYRLGNITKVSRRLQFPLIMRHVENYVKERVVLIGDAAHTIHPLAGLGVNMGILDAATLSEVLREVRKKPEKIGKFATLRRYERWRKGNNQLMLSVVRGFKYLFGNEQPVLRWLRNTGLILTDHCPPAKAMLMKNAMGLGGDLPQLARYKKPCAE